MKFKGKEFDGQDYIIQVAPEDCTGCKLCVEVCPGQGQEGPDQEGLLMAPQMPLRETRARELRLLPRFARGGSPPGQGRHGQGCAVPAAALRVLGRLLGLRRNAVLQAADPALRRPRHHRATPRAARRSTAATCPPRRSPRTRTAVVRPGTTRSSRTTPSSGSAAA